MWDRLVSSHWDYAAWAAALNRCLRELVGLLVTRASVICWDSPDGDLVAPRYNPGALLYGRYREALARSNAV